MEQQSKNIRQIAAACALVLDVLAQTEPKLDKLEEITDSMKDAHKVLKFADFRLRESQLELQSCILEIQGAVENLCEAAEALEAKETIEQLTIKAKGRRRTA